MTDAAWERALNSAARQFESYVRQGRLETPEQRREALSDALQHAVGLLKLSKREFYDPADWPDDNDEARDPAANDLKAAVSDD